MTQVEIRLFGSFALRMSADGNRFIELQSRKEQWLLAILAMRNGAPVSRLTLAAMLWPDSSDEQALAYLRKALYKVKHALGTAGGMVQAVAPRSVRLDPLGIRCDLLQFESAATLNTTESLREACLLYSGSLLEGCHDEWVDAPRRAAEQLCLQCREKLAEDAVKRGSTPEAIAHVRALVQLDPLRESAHRLLMTALADDGDTGAMVSAYRDLRLLLRREVNQEPDSETVDLYNSLRSRSTVGQRGTSTARVRGRSAEGKQDLTTASTKLALDKPKQGVPQIPRALTALIGRAHELETAISALNSVALVTLIGTGGVGKTRVAAAAAQQLATLEPVWFAELAAATDRDGVVRAVASATNANQNAGTDLEESVMASVSQEHGILILDNCEHLLEACSDLAIRLLQRCTHLRILATSRQALGVPGEFLVSISPLKTPPASLVRSGLPVPAEVTTILLEYDSVALFVQSAKSVFPSFELTKENCEHVAAICTRLDGIPLAIELAAARIRVLSAQQIARRLSDRFGLLTSGARHQIPQHQTLRALIDWSYGLLTNREQRMLSRLSVFSGFTLEMAEQVVPDDSHSGQASLDEQNQINRANVMDLISALIEKSLITLDPQYERYRLLETIKEYASEKLGSGPERRDLCRAHCNAYLEYINSLAGKLVGRDVSEGMKQCEREYENIRAALRWAVDGCEYDSNANSALEFCAALSAFWVFRGYHAEGADWCNRALARINSDEVSALRASAVSVCGTLIWLQGRHQEALAYHTTALKIREALADSRGIAGSLERLGAIASGMGDTDRARECFGAAIQIATEMGDLTVLARAQINLGCLMLQVGENTNAAAAFQAAREIAHGSGDRVTHALALANLAYIAASTKNYSGARQLYDEAIATLRDCGDRGGVALTVFNLAGMLKDQGDIATSRMLTLESLNSWLDLGIREHVVSAIERLAYLEIDESRAGADCEWVTAAKLIGACNGLRLEIRVPLVGDDVIEQRAYIEAIEENVGTAACREAMASGKVLRLEEAAAYAQAGSVK